MNISNNVSKLFRMAIAVSALASMLAHGSPASASAQASAPASSEACAFTASSAPAMANACVGVRVSTDANDLITVKYWGNQNYDFYRLRWSRDGAADKQVKVRGQSGQGSQWVLKNTNPGSTYTFKVQACFNKAAGLDCTAWQEATFLLPADGIHAQ
jgi:hypothetical protein